MNIRLKGCYPGAIGKITELHATYYYKNWGFDVSFETQVGRELSEFISGFEEERDGFWIAAVDGQFAGSIAIDGRRGNVDGVRLRWFIVPPEYQGKGIGRTLLRTALTFCKNIGYTYVYLWTFKGLDAARALYEAEGFRLREEHNVKQWGNVIAEQKFVLQFEN
ncbi:MAG: GNAT family N-acetyltransferase [Deltaproteobacteria bacterium]|nr:GNAT family N-acetyltransferase [Deltaproteobacteria bacterium]